MTIMFISQTSLPVTGMNFSVFRTVTSGWVTRVMCLGFLQCHLCLNLIILSSELSRQWLDIGGVGANTAQCLQYGKVH